MNSGDPSDLATEVVDLQDQLERERERCELGRKTIEILEKEVKSLDGELKNCKESKEQIFKELKIVMAKLQSDDPGGNKELQEKYDKARKELKAAWEKNDSLENTIEELKATTPGKEAPEGALVQKEKELEEVKRKSDGAAKRFLEEIEGLKQELKVARDRSQKLESEAQKSRASPPAEEAEELDRLRKKVAILTEMVNKYKEAYTNLKDKYQSRSGGTEAEEQEAPPKSAPAGAPAPAREEKVDGAVIRTKGDGKKVVLKFDPPETTRAEKKGGRKKQKCPFCNGVGKIIVKDRKEGERKMPCPRCLGKG